MLKLLKNKTIDEHLYQLWIVDKMEKLNGLRIIPTQKQQQKNIMQIGRYQKDNDQETNDSITKGV